MPTAAATKKAPEPEPEPEEEGMYVDPARPHTFTDGDEPPSNASKKSFPGYALQMSMGFDCNNNHGNPGDWAVWINGNWYVMSEV